MDKKQLKKIESTLNREVLESVKNSEIQIVNHKQLSNFSKTKGGKIENVLNQRHSQRAWLFWFSLGFVAVTTLIVFVLIIWQAFLNLDGSSISLINNRTLQVIVTGIFVQFVGLMGIITKSIWNDKPYLDAGVMQRSKDG